MSLDGALAMSKTPEGRRLPRRRPSGLLAVATVTLVATVAACGGGGGGARPAAAPAPAAVAIELYAFTPAALTVDAGQPVTWTEKDDDLEGEGAHSIVADDKSFDSGLVKKGASFTFKPSKSGTIAYHCGIHNYMTGTITVR